MIRAPGSRSGTAWRAGVVGMALVLAAGLAEPRQARAVTGIVRTLPKMSVTPRSGLRLTVDARWVEGPGYCPVQVQIRTTTTSVADRTVTIRFRAGFDAGEGEASIEVEQQIDVPAGAQTVDAVLSVPHYEPWRAISWDTWVDGRRVDELSSPRLWIPSVSRYQSRGNVPSVLFVGTPLAAARALGELGNRLDADVGGPLPIGTRGATSVGTRPGSPSSEKFIAVAVADLPTRWISYSCLDIVCLSADAIRQTKAQQPEAWQAIVAWTRSGGNLWIYGVGDGWDRLGELERATGLSSRPPDAPADLPGRGWQLPTGREPQGEFWPDGSSVNGQRLGFGRGVAQRRTTSIRTLPRDTARPGFAWRDLQFGRIVAMASDAPFPGSARALAGPASPTATVSRPKAHRVSLEWVLGAVGLQRFLWEHRHGLSTRFPTSDFWHFLIPGVGLAPVTAFHVLITLFVLVLGPLNYFLLYRRNRLHLLVVTVPLGAALITGGLFAYAVLADGLATRVRARSLTLLDQRQGHVVRWVRLSYYAGLTPSAGLTFPADTVVYPLLPSEGSFYGGRSYQRLTGLGLQWRDAQHLTHGWLRARTPTQYVTVQSTATDAGLQIRADRRPIQVGNQLGASLQLLILADSQGRFHWAQGVERAATVRLEGLPEAEAIGKIRAVIADAQLRLPPGMQNASRRNAWSRRQSPLGLPKQANAMPEQVIKALTIVPSSSGSAWQKKMYVAIANSPTGIDLGVTDAHEEAGLHVIVGRW